MTILVTLASAARKCVALGERVNGPLKVADLARIQGPGQPCYERNGLLPLLVLGDLQNDASGHSFTALMSTSVRETLSLAAANTSA